MSLSWRVQTIVVISQVYWKLERSEFSSNFEFDRNMLSGTGARSYMWVGTVYPKKYAHGFVVLCFVVVMQSFILNSHEVFIHIHQGCFAGTGAIVRLPQCQWSKPDGYEKISQWITTTKHSKAKTVCIFLGIYCICARSTLEGLYCLMHKQYVCYSYAIIFKLEVCNSHFVLWRTEFERKPAH